MRRLVVLVLLLVACGDAESSKDTDDKSPATMTDGGSIYASDGAVRLPEGCDPIDTTYEGYAKAFFEERCTACHSVSAVGDVRLGAPEGIDFDEADDIAFHQVRIARRAIDERGMPPGAPLSDCEAAQLASYLQSLGGAGSCQPSCDGKTCGPDGCGGVCGECKSSEMCGSAGVCVDVGCSPNCVGVACGDDGCGGVCGTCGDGLHCATGQCVCEPACDGRSCGDDGCGGSCGDCTGGDVCDATGQCLCIPSCDGKLCGDDGCGGSCGQCAPGKACEAGACVCSGSCVGKTCGDDGCGVSCGTCKGALECNTRTNKCVANCVPDCTGRQCGDDGCGGSCGAACADGKYCTAAGQCECEPICEGKACGTDGCNDVCGECAQGLSCSGGQCGCEADCSGRECGSDGCGGSCGECDADLSCNAGACVAQCVPSCSGKDCGGDGCGGTCGSCGATEACEVGQCVAAPVTFDTVFGLFQTYGCSDMGCHGGNKPAEGLNLSSKTVAQAELVGVTSGQCATKKLVVAGEPTQSYLINKLTGVGMCSGSQMPKGGAAMSAADIDKIRAWIAGL